MTVVAVCPWQVVAPLWGLGHLLDRNDEERGPQVHFDNPAGWEYVTEGCVAGVRDL